MKKRIPLLLVVIGVAAFLVPPLWGENPALPAQRDCPSCEAFGVQRFEARKEAPAFSLKSLDGSQVSLKDFKGKPVLLVFWATWCPSCREELPWLEKFSVEKRDQLTILLIAIDGEREKKIRRMIKEMKITTPVLLILKEKIMDNYGIRGWVPIIFLIDGEGVIVGKIVGERDWSAPAAWSCIRELFSLR
jgi:thiol-disulfide isomerase/thioredoxin